MMFEFLFEVFEILSFIALVVVGWIIMAQTRLQSGCEGLYYLGYVYVTFVSIGLGLELAVSAYTMLMEQEEEKEVITISEITEIRVE